MNDSTTTTSTSTDDNCRSTICHCMPGIGMGMNMNISPNDDSVFHGQAMDIILVVNVNADADANAKPKSVSPSSVSMSTTTTTAQHHPTPPIQTTSLHDNPSDNHNAINNDNTNLLLLSSSSTPGSDTTTITTTPISIACNDFNVSFPGRRGIVRVQIHGIYMEGLDMISSPKEGCRFLHGNTKKPSLRALQQLQSYLLQYSKQQQQQQQQEGGYPIRFHLFDSKTTSETTVILGIAEATMFLWQSTDSIVACDIDGTITKSNVRGAWDTIVTERYDHVHPGVAGFLQTLQLQHALQQQKQQQLHIVYLTSRPMSLVATTRKFLQTFEQQQEGQQEEEEAHNGTVSTTTTTKLVRLPAGPIFCNLLDLGSVLMSELWWKDVYRYKKDVLTSQILLPFQMVSHDLSMSSSKTTTAASAAVDGTTKPHDGQSTLVMGFGNTTFDTMAYEMAGIPLDCIYQINERGMIKCYDDTSSHVPVTVNSSERQQPPPKDYTCMKGSTFQGYTDPKLLEDVQRKLNQCC